VDDVKINGCVVYEGDNAKVYVSLSEFFKGKNSMFHSSVKASHEDKKLFTLPEPIVGLWLMKCTDSDEKDNEIVTYYVDIEQYAVFDAHRSNDWLLAKLYNGQFDLELSLVRSKLQTKRKAERAVADAEKAAAAKKKEEAELKAKNKPLNRFEKLKRKGVAVCTDCECEVELCEDKEAHKESHTKGVKTPEADTPSEPSSKKQKTDHKPQTASTSTSSSSSSSSSSSFSTATKKKKDDEEEESSDAEPINGNSDNADSK
jgi:hypothetical protein